MATDGYHPGESLYRKWAGLVAESVASWLSEESIGIQAEAL
jgi:hypothetical protein